MKTTLLISIALSIFFFVSAVIILKGRGDWMISNYQRLPAEQKARINLPRLRMTMAGMLTFLAAVIPLHFSVRSERQMVVISTLSIVVLLIFLLVAHCWAGMPLFINPFKRK